MSRLVWGGVTYRTYAEAAEPYTIQISLNVPLYLPHIWEARHTA